MLEIRSGYLTHTKTINEERCSLDVSLGLEVVSLVQIYFGLHVCIMRCRESKGYGCFSCLGTFFLYFEPEFIFVVLLVLIGSPRICLYMFARWMTRAKSLHSGGEENQSENSITCCFLVSLHLA